MSGSPQRFEYEGSHGVLKFKVLTVGLFPIFFTANFGYLALSGTELTKGESTAIVLGLICCGIVVLGFAYRSGFVVDGKSKSLTWWRGFFSYRSHGPTIQGDQLTCLEVYQPGIFESENRGKKVPVEGRLDLKEVREDDDEDTPPTHVYLKVGQKTVHLANFPNEREATLAAQTMADLLELPPQKRVFRERK